MCPNCMIVCQYQLGLPIPNKKKKEKSLLVLLAVLDVLHLNCVDGSVGCGRI